MLRCRMVSVMLLLQPIYALSERSGTFFPIHGDDIISTQTVAETFSNLPKIKCAFRCLEATVCEGFNLRHISNGLGDCEILESSTRPSLDLVAESSSLYFQQVDKRLCSDQSLCHTYGYDLTWDEAFEICPKIDPATHLADIMSLEESEDLNALADSMGLAANGDWFWLGARRPVGGALMDFTWVHTGAPASGVSGMWTNWYGGQPNKLNYACLSSSVSWGGKWGDYGCSFRFIYFCQF